MKKKLPDRLSEAKKWLDPDTFVLKGKTYRIEPDGTVREIVNEKEENIDNRD